MVVDFGGLVRQRRDDVQAFGICKGILGICCRPVERARAIAVNLNLVCPDIGIQCVEVVVEDKTVLMVRHILNLRKTDICTEKNTDGNATIHDPGILLRLAHARIFEPRLLVLAHESITPESMLWSLLTGEVFLPRRGPC